MSYLVLSLKYRPQTFEEVVGQEHVTQTLINAFKKDRVSQGYLFTGPRGVGKTTAARLVAKALNCMESPGNPCNKCSNCMEITDGRNMDVLEIDGASNRGIEEIRGLREAIQYAPINSKYKIFIIDEVHMLTTPAFNALLRTLEEPPEHGKFILATTDIYKVPATIISRCQRFDFNSISIKDIGKQIKYVLEKEKIEIDEDSLKIIAQKADGSMRDALSILDQVIAYSGENISIESVNKVLGLIPNEIYFNIIEAIRIKDGKTLIDILAEVKSTGMPIQQFVTGLNRHIRNMMIGSVEDGLDALEMNADLKIKYIESSKVWNIRDLLRISNVITEVEPKVKRAVQPHILIELSLLKLLEMDSVVTIQSLLDNLKNTKIPNFPNSNKSAIAEPMQSRQSLVIEKPELKETVADNNTPSKVEVTDKISEPKYIPKSNKNITFQEIEDKWEKCIDDLSSERPSIGNALAHCELGQLSGNRLEIKMINGNNFNLRTLEKNKIFIETFLEKTYEVKIKTAFLMTKSELPKTDNNIEKEKIVKTNKTTAKIIEVFDGELIN